MKAKYILKLLLLSVVAIFVITACDSPTEETQTFGTVKVITSIEKVSDLWDYTKWQTNPDDNDSCTIRGIIIEQYADIKFTSIPLNIVAGQKVFNILIQSYTVRYIFNHPFVALLDQKIPMQHELHGGDSLTIPILLFDGNQIVEIDSTLVGSTPVQVYIDFELVEQDTGIKRTLPIKFYGQVGDISTEIDECP